MNVKSKKEAGKMDIIIIEIIAINAAIPVLDLLLTKVFKIL